MNILFLGYNESQTSLIGFIKSKNHNVTHYDEKITLDLCKNYDFIISYGYQHIIRKDIINYFGNKIINLHISYLPYNRGSYPNYWSFHDKTPSGVTIHLINEGIDTGDILVQKRVYFKSKENTLRITYEILKKEIEILCMKHFDDIINNRIIPSKQPHGGTIHFDSELPKNIDWDKKIF